jgi:hypothetical protein
MNPLRIFLVSAGLALGISIPLAIGCSSSSSPTQSSPGGDSGPSSDAGTSPDATGAATDANDDFVGPGSPPPSMTNLPEAGVFMGAFVDIIDGYDAGDATDTNSEGRYVAAEDLVGRRFVIDNRFYDDSTEIVSDRTLWDVANNLVPMITWMPYGNGNPLVEIIQGEHDDWIKSEADKLKALNVQVLMRWGHEMNGNWYPWAGYVNGEGGDADGGDAATDAGGVPSSGPAKYVAAWRHVHDIFAAEGATNVVWVWCTNSNDVPDAPWNHWTLYYPGDDYVDWVGIDAYNWGNSSSCCIWTTFAGLLTGSPYQDYSAKKPIMLPETASAEVGGNKGAWITAMHQNLETEFRGIRAVVWFDINKETDWRIDSSPSSLAAYQAMALDPYFNP